MDVSKLEGAELDAAVAKVEGVQCRATADAVWITDTVARPGVRETGPCEWRPSVLWSQGGPIIERERIAVIPGTNADPFGSGWTATAKLAKPMIYAEGPTPLIAAMRALVASKIKGE